MILDYRRITKDFLIAAVAQGFGFILGVVTSLIVPKLLSLESFGYWQLFLFYSSFVGFFHFGLNDGVYLIKGGQSRRDINGKEIRSQFAFGVGFQLLIALALVIMAMAGVFGVDREFVIMATAGYLLVSNATSFLGLLLQAMNETRVYSWSLMVNQVAFLCALTLLLCLGVYDYHQYIVFYILAKLCALLFCVVRTREIILGGLLPFGQLVEKSIESIRVGIKLTIANITSMLIFGIVRFAVDLNWGIEAFGQLSLAISLMSFVLTFVSQLGMVLFPALRDAGAEEVNAFFFKLRDASMLLFPIVYVLYGPLAFAIALWLPQYQTAVSWFALLLPACVYDGKMNICYMTYFKVCRKENSMLLINLATVALSSSGVLLGVVVLDSAEVAILCAVGAIAVRAVFSEWYIFSQINRGGCKAIACDDIVLAVSFLAVSFVCGYGETGILCTVLYGLFLLKNQKKIIELVKGVDLKFHGWNRH